MIKKSLAAVAAALGLLTVPVATVQSRPAPAEARGETPSPVAKTDGRHTRMYVPKTHSPKKSRLTRFTNAVMSGGLPNRHARRSVARAAMQGRGRLTEGFATRGEAVRVRTIRRDGKTVGAVQTTARAVERARRAGGAR